MSGEIRDTALVVGPGPYRVERCDCGVDGCPVWHVVSTINGRDLAICASRSEAVAETLRDALTLLEAVRAGARR